MSLIEGLGDEVTVVLICLLLLTVILVAWISTHTTDLPFFSVIVVELSQRSSLNNGNQQNVNNAGGSENLGTVSVNSNSTSVEETLQTHPVNQSALENSENVASVSEFNLSDGAQAAILRSDTSQEGCLADNSSSSCLLGDLAEDCVQGSSDKNDSQKHKCFESDKLDSYHCAHVLSPSEGGLMSSGCRVDENVSAENATSTIVGGGPLHKRTLGEQHHSLATVPLAGEVQERDSCVDEQIAADHSTKDDPLPDSSELRQRRLHFFESRNISSCDGQSVTSNQLELPFVQGSNVSEKLDISVASDLASPQVSSVAEAKKFDQQAAEVAGYLRAADDSLAGEPVNEMQSGQIRVRLKFLNETLRLVRASPTDTVGNFRREHFSTELAENKLVRFVFNGHDLRNDSTTLEAYNIVDNSIIHCLVTGGIRTESQRPLGQGSDSDLQLGAFIFPLFGLVLGALWYTRLSYRHFFNAFSTVVLAAITFLFLVAYASSFRSRHARLHLD